MTQSTFADDYFLTSKIPIEYQGSARTDAITFELPSQAYALDWQNDTLVYGHETGVTILTRHTDPAHANNLPTELQRHWFFRKEEIDLGQEVAIVKFRRDIIAAVHEDTISVLNITTGEKYTLEGHTSYINSVDISADGKTIVSTGDDRMLIVWDESNHSTKFPLEGTGKVARFWEGPAGDRVVVLEAVNKIRVLDWKKSEWLVTIYPAQSGCCGPSSGSVKDIAITSTGDILAVGLGWWKKYILTTLSGGCGYTIPNAENRFSKSSPGAVVAVSSKGQLIGLAGSGNVEIHDPNNEFSSGSFSLNLKIPGEITGLALRDRGDTLVVATGRQLTIVKNPNVDYEQNEQLDIDIVESE